MWKPIIKVTAAILGLLIAGAYIVGRMMPPDTQRSKPRLLGRIWCDKTRQPPHVFYITEEERNYKQTFRGGGRYSMPTYRNIQYSRYRLERRTAPKGDLSARAVIADIKDARTGDGPVILGAIDAGIWVWNRGPELYDPATLTLVFSTDKLKQLNPEIASTFPESPEQAKVSALHNALVIRTSNLKYLVIDAATGKAGPADLEKFRNIYGVSDVAEGFRHVPQPGRSLGSLSERDFMASSLATTGTETLWYALLSDEKRAKVGRWPSVGSPPHGDEWRSLYAAPYTLDRKNKLTIDPAALEKRGDVQLLNAGFLHRASNQAWSLTDPKSVLVLHKLDLKKSADWQVGRLTGQGEMVWNRATTLNEIFNICDAGDHLVVFGYQPSDQPTLLRPGYLGFLDVKSGDLHLQRLDELSKEDQLKRPPLSIYQQLKPY